MPLNTIKIEFQPNTCFELVIIFEVLVDIIYYLVEFLLKYDNPKISFSHFLNVCERDNKSLVCRVVTAASISELITICRKNCASFIFSRPKSLILLQVVLISDLNGIG